MREKRPRQVDPVLVRRILITLGMLVIARIGLHIPLPGIDGDVLQSFLAQEVAGSFQLHSRWSIFVLGIAPYISASVLVLLATGLIAPLRRLRDGGEGTQKRFDQVIVSLTVVIGFLQAFGLAISIDNMLAGNPWPLSATGEFSRPIAMLTMVTGTLLLVFLAEIITRYGVGNGIALIMLTTSLADFLPTLFQEIRLPADPSVSPAERLLLVVFTVVFIAAVTIFLRAKRSVRLLPLKSVGTGGSSEGRPLDVPIRINITGAMPLILAHSILVFPATLVGFGFLSESVVWPYGSVRYWIAACVLIILSTFLLTSWVFNARNMLGTARKWGFGIAGGISDDEDRAAIERSLAWRTMGAALCLCALSLVPSAVISVFGVDPQLSFFFGASSLVSVAIILDTIDNIRRRPPQVQDSEESEVSSQDSWVSVLSLETWLEIEAARRILEDAGISSAARFNRAICATGSLAPWEVCRPTFPSLVVYRGLGGGQASLLVPYDQLEQARIVLAPFTEDAS